jgi:hypothetical protein
VLSGTDTACLTRELAQHYSSFYDFLDILKVFVPLFGFFLLTSSIF